jgi:uncharacterized membrane protein (DUF485 family)
MQTSMSPDIAVGVARADRAPTAAAPAPTPAPAGTIDWEAAIRDPAFRALVVSRRRFVVPAAVGSFAWILIWLLLVAYAQDFMGRQIADGVSVMFVTGLSQFAVAWAVTWSYLRRSRLVWRPLQEQAIAALERHRVGGPAR